MIGLQKTDNDLRYKFHFTLRFQNLQTHNKTSWYSGLLVSSSSVCCVKGKTNPTPKRHERKRQIRHDRNNLFHYLYYLHYKGDHVVLVPD